ncbi:hypothetical protein [uncultured Bacteroides sp.]|uniref:hypothetical protein n=1 Tax=uncultured Bacteroides sp. TaxID=162156 RepID=UPI002AA82127|nr:hypothetical protein [uncultured Bacteroides sp.]
MNRRILKYEILIAYSMGLLTFVLSSIFRDSLSDFAKGFCEGFSLLTIFTGLAYGCWCAVKKKNPYKI